MVRGIRSYLARLGRQNSVVARGKWQNDVPVNDVHLVNLGEADQTKEEGTPSLGSWEKEG
jgi:hypothetical protein